MVVIIPPKVLSALKILGILAWFIGFIPFLVWLTLVQFVPQASYDQVFLPFMLGYTVLISIELFSVLVARGQKQPTSQANQPQIGTRA